MSNLIFAKVDNEGNIHSRIGWFVTVSNRKAHVCGVGHVASPHVVKCGDAHWLQSVSIKKTCGIIETRSEDSPYPSKIPEFKIELSPEEDDNIYYMFDLPKEMKLSKDFEVIMDTLVEDPYISEKYDRMVIASRPDDSPLLVDNQGTICISPI